MNWQSQRYEPPNRPSAEAGPSHSRSGSSAGNSFARPSSHQRSYSDAFSDTQSHGARGSIDRDDDGEEGDRYEDNIGATPRNARFDHASSDDHHHQHDSQHDPTLAWRTPDNAEDEHFRARLEAVAISPSTAESEYAGVIPDLSEIGHGHPPGHLHSDGAGTYEQDPGTAKLSPEARAEADDLGDVGDAVHFVLLAEFDIDQGSTLAYQYPYPTGTDEQCVYPFF